MIFNCSNELESFIKKCMKVAFDRTAEEVRSELSRRIYDEFYGQYSPVLYSRTNQFINSPDIKRISDSLVEIFVNTDRMNYPTFSGEKVALYATDGWHGQYIQTSGRYWDSFLEWCSSNIKNIYANQLRALGINVS